MAEMFVSPLVLLLIENLAPVALSFVHSGGIDRKLKQWTDMPETIEAVLEDAEDRQLKEKPIQLWLHDVQKLAFEIEDFVDGLATEAQRRRIVVIPESSCSGRLRYFTSKFNPTAIRFNYDMDGKIGEISNSLKELGKRKNDLPLQKYVGGKPERTGDLRLPLTSSLVDTARVCGREEDSAAILTWLLKEGRMSNHDGKVRIISIVGMGGIGKTTMAQSLYNNGQVEGCFPHRVGVCVTDDFDVFRISKIIYENVYEKGCEFTDLNMVQQKLREKLSSKKFLLVLDDVWNQDYGKWDLLCAPNFDGHPESKEVGEVIAKRCKGLSLAARTLGGLLCTKRNPNQWIEVSTSKIWELQSNDIIPALRLSYHHLPPYFEALVCILLTISKGLRV